MSELFFEVSKNRIKRKWRILLTVVFGVLIIPCASAKNLAIVFGGGCSGTTAGKLIDVPFFEDLSAAARALIKAGWDPVYEHVKNRSGTRCVS